MDAVSVMLWCWIVLRKKWAWSICIFPYFITKASQWTRWRLKSRLFIQSCIQAQIKETSKLRVTDLWPVNSPHKWPVTRKMFPFDEIMSLHRRDNWIHFRGRHGPSYRIQPKNSDPTNPTLCSPSVHGWVVTKWPLYVCINYSQGAPEGWPKETPNARRFQINQ